MRGQIFIRQQAPAPQPRQADDDEIAEAATLKPKPQPELKETKAPLRTQPNYTTRKDDIPGAAETRAAASAQQGRQERPMPAKAAARVGRNDPCPCGSGKKYKNCHGRGL